MNSGHNVVILLAIIIGLMFHAFMYATQPAIMAEMFPTRMRYSGVSLGYQVTSIVAGSLAPIIAVKLLDIYGSSVPIAVYLAVACAITVVAVVVARETKGLALESIDIADAKNLATEAELAKAGLLDPRVKR
jgi:MFS family permease